MENGFCQIEGLCQNFFHPRDQVLNQHLYQAPDTTLDQTFEPPTTEFAVEVAPVAIESPVFRLLRERLSWAETPEVSRPTSPSPADAAVQGFQQILLMSRKNGKLTDPVAGQAPVQAPAQVHNQASVASPATSPSPSPKTTQTRLMVHERVQLESIWRKQVDKNSVRTNLFGGKGIPTSELSVNQVRLGRTQ